MIAGFLHFREGAAHQIEMMARLAAGLTRHGVHSLISSDWQVPPEATFVACWGDKVPNNIELPRLILEAGYINGRSGNYVRDRLQFVSAGWNGLHGRAGPVRPDRPPDRWRALGIELLPWRIGGEYALVCDNHPGDSVSAGFNWWAPLDELIDAPLVYRPHPLLAPDMRPLREALSKALLCITWSSTAAVESVIAGVPTVAYDPGSIAWPVTSRNVTDAVYVGPREQWAYDLAYRQFTPDELQDGIAWEELRHGLATTDTARP